jgi:hypothetical protein
VIEKPCSDCGFPATMTAPTLRRGSLIREPGEMLCPSCMAHRTRMVRELNEIPNTIDQIAAKRMVRGAA